MRYLFSGSSTFSRRYELPTCLLEIWTERSPLSDWQSQIVAQNLRFRLRLFDSKRVVKGDQQQITNLIEAVTNYCDRWLAQDDFDSLDHAIAIPKLSNLKLSTLQLFDLYESLELCANEFLILPSVVLEVRRLNPNWLKIIVAAIAILGVSIGAIRLISREQPSYQMASTPAISSPEQAPSAILENKSASKSENQLENKLANNSKNGDASKSANQPNFSIPSPSSQTPNRKSQILENQQPKSTDKVAIARAPNSPNSVITGNSSSDRQRKIDNSSINNSPIDNSPAMSDGITTGSSQPSLEPSNKDVTAEAFKPSPAAPSASLPSITSRSQNTDVATTNIKINIKVLQIQSELPSDINTDLVRYIQSQFITQTINQSIPKSTTGAIAFDLEISGDRIRNILINNQDSTLQDRSSIAQLEAIILKWRSPNSVTGKVRLILQL